MNNAQLINSIVTIVGAELNIYRHLTRLFPSLKLVKLSNPNDFDSFNVEVINTTSFSQTIKLTMGPSSGKYTFINWGVKYYAPYGSDFIKPNVGTTNQYILNIYSCDACTSQYFIGYFCQDAKQNNYYVYVIVKIPINNKTTTYSEPYLVVSQTF